MAVINWRSFVRKVESIILTETSLAQIEILLAFQSLALAAWYLLAGGDCHLALLREQMLSLSRIFGHEKWLAGGLVAINVIRLLAVGFDQLTARRWVAFLSACGWLSVVLAYVWARVGANELAIYFVGFVANFWIFVRLDERAIRLRRSATTRV